MQNKVDAPCKVGLIECDVYSAGILRGCKTPDLCIAAKHDKAQHGYT